MARFSGDGAAGGLGYVGVTTLQPPAGAAMPRHEPLDPWADRLATHFPDLPRPVTFVLALWTYGLALAHSGRLSAVAVHLAPLLGRPFHTTRPRLREFDGPAVGGAGGGDAVAAGGGRA